MAGLELRAELLAGVESRVDVAANAPLCRGECVGDFGKGRIADDKDVDVAVVAQLATRCRAEHEGHADFCAEWLQAVADDVDDAARLQDDRVKLLEDRAAAVRLEVDLSALRRPPKDSRPHERSELPLNGAECRARLPDDLSQVEALSGSAIEQRQDLSACRTEQHG